MNSRQCQEISSEWCSEWAHCWGECSWPRTPWSTCDLITHRTNSCTTVAQQSPKRSKCCSFYIHFLFSNLGIQSQSLSLCLFNAIQQHFPWAASTFPHIFIRTLMFHFLRGICESCCTFTLSQLFNDAIKKKRRQHVFISQTSPNFTTSRAD